MNCSLLVYVDTADFLLDLVHCNFAEFIYQPQSVLCVFRGIVYVHRYDHGICIDSFNSSFPTWMPFFSCLIALAKIPSIDTVLNSISENGHSCLVPILEEKLCLFRSVMLALDLFAFFLLGFYRPYCMS